ncbi:MAG: glucans biosynthesis glucosyltransferase MdoH [Bradyrhizobium sp.]|uniref:glucans biosynthesis glucosyltransferase MdoH n=1 Tax=Bradyrhizobium sp. TaxID=376 RepID=UPI0025C6F2A2|nr:glucans biosynthesis glucosyltransferase MdoH [Bradyrhizobium sp.]MBI5263548.1 glucans biosynthesis glucosyltransferase MdoH [Bradyrhizobium sp.]
MGALTKPSSRLTPDSGGLGLLPREAPLPMVPGRLDHVPRTETSQIETGGFVALRRALVFAGTAVVSAGGAYEMYEALKVGGVTLLEATLLALFVVLLAWIAFSFVSALAGFFVLLARRPDTLPIETRGPLPEISGRTAMLLPTYNEDPHHVTARLRAMFESVAETGHAERFDWFLLSDSTNPEIWVCEELAFLELRAAYGDDHLFYRHRSNNTARKSGNIAEWVGRFGGAYDYMIILDADSLMTGDTIVRLVHAMDAHPQAALIQTLPVIVNARSLFSRLQQFAARLYGPLIAAGNAWWYGSEGNYWGHNAIIRVRAFAQEAGLPELRGRRPFGGHILSHDFIEAALMRRAGWGIFMTVNLGGSFEEVPPSLLDFAARDRRWCQGNLQHIAILRARGLHWVSRLHLLTGIGSYVTAPLWLLFLLLGLLISLQAYFVRPEYFPKGFALFPTWPAQDPIRAAWVFGATMALLVVPKLLAYLVLLARSRERQAFGAPGRVLAGVIAETMLAALIAPSMMIFQSGAVIEILLGRDAGWQVQRRSDGQVTRDEICRKLAIPTLCGIVMAICAYAVSLPLLLWMSPVIIGLTLAIPMGVVTSAPVTMGRLFVTPEDRAAPPILVRARELASGSPSDVTSALVELRQNPELLKWHSSSLGPEKRTKSDRIDVDLAIARAKLDDADTFEEAVGLLSRRETLAVLKNRRTLVRFLDMPSGQSNA